MTTTTTSSRDERASVASRAGRARDRASRVSRPASKVRLDRRCRVPRASRCFGRASASPQRGSAGSAAAKQSAVLWLAWIAAPKCCSLARLRVAAAGGDGRATSGSRPSRSSCSVARRTRGQAGYSTALVHQPAVLDPASLSLCALALAPSPPRSASPNIALDTRLTAPRSRRSCFEHCPRCVCSLCERSGELRGGARRFLLGSSGTETDPPSCLPLALFSPQLVLGRSQPRALLA